MKTIIGLDPGTEKSAIVVFDGERPTWFSIESNEEIVGYLSDLSPERHLAIEMVESFGMAVGREVFETVFWTGRFCESFNGDFTRIGRKEIKLHLCNSLRAKDANIRRALIDRFPSTGGGKTPQIGTIKQPGPLYGMNSHLWSALAVAVTWWDRKLKEI